MVQFAQQQTKNLSELVDQKDQEISELKIEVKNLNSKIQSLELLQGHSEVTAGKLLIKGNAHGIN